MRNTPPTPRRVRAAHESKSAAVRAAAAAPSRRQQSKWQREQHHQRTLYLAIGVMVALVLAIFAGGIFYDNVVRANEVVAQVGPDSITATQLLDQIRPSVRAMDSQAKQLGNTASVAQYVDQQKRSMPDQTLNDLIDQHVIAQEAARRGISVDPAALDDKERQTVADFQASTAAAAATPDALATPDPASTPGAAPTPAVAAPTPDAAAPTPDAAALAAAVAAVSTAAPATTPTAVATLDPTGYGPALQQLLDRNSLTEAEFRDRLQQSMLRDQLQTAIGQEQVPDTQEQVHVLDIQVATAPQANDILTQLQGGADFGQLAQQVSTDTASKSKGGDLGWLARGSGLDKALEDAAFALQAGQLSDVIQGTGGYHVLQVVERDPARAVPADQLTSQRQKAFSDWLSARRSSQDVKLQLSQTEKDWILTKIGLRP